MLKDAITNFFKKSKKTRNSHRAMSLIYYQLTTPNSQLPTPNSQLPTSNFQLPTPNYPPTTPNSQLPTPNSQLPTTHSPLPTTHYYPLSTILCQQCHSSQKHNFYSSLCYPKTNSLCAGLIGRPTS